MSLKIRINYKVIFFVILSGYFLFLFRADIFGNFQLDQDYTALQTQLMNEQTLNQDLKSRLQNLKKEDCIEQLARVKLGLVKDKETPYKVFMEE